MADLFTLTGSFATTPRGGSTSGIPSVQALLNERLSISKKSTTRMSLDVDTPVAVDFGGIANAHVLSIKSIGGKVTARVTSADGSAQSVPVDSLLLLISSTVPVTAVDLTRVAGTATNVEIFMGEIA